MNDAEKQELMSDVMRDYKSARNRLVDRQEQAKEWARALREAADHLDEQVAKPTVFIQLNPALRLPSLDNVDDLSRKIAEEGEDDEEQEEEDDEEEELIR